MTYSRIPVLLALFVLCLLASAVARAGEGNTPAVSGTDHWAYKRPVRAALPDVQDSAWAQQPIDRFVLARLEEQQLQPQPVASRERLIRRLSLDLTGLPPTPDEVDAFLANNRPDAYEQLVERLLASPRYGEHWAATWLDFARYADSQGYEKDNLRTIWRYRDWVISALNQDMPFDRFTLEQLAGDLLSDPSEQQLIATAFHRNTMTNTEGGTDDEEFRVAAVVDRVNTTMAVWMGTTFGCSQCHSHKYDPFSHREYYQFFAFFNQTEDHDQPDEQPTLATPTPREEQQLQKLRKEHETLEAKLAAAPETKDELQPKLDELKKKIDEFSITTTPILRELPEDKRRTTRIMLRGNFLDTSDEVEPGVPAILHSLPDEAPSNRIGVARWLTDENNPLTARVMVNRQWEQLFGLGLVETSEDFGTQGQLASHPEMLDWMAIDWMQSGWSLKDLHRSIVTSATYRQAATVTPELMDRDPFNRLLARGPRVRLSAEQVRDQALAVAGLLASKMYGPSVMPPQPEGVWQIVYSGDKWTTSEGDDRYRRGLYTVWRRTTPYPSMVTFDAPSREFCVLRRMPTNTPLQALVTMNDPVYVEAARALADKTLQQPGSSQDRLRQMFRRVLARFPEERELTRLKQALDEERDYYSKHLEEAAKLLGEDAPGTAHDAERAAWIIVANVLLNLDETLTKG